MNMRRWMLLVMLVGLYVSLATAQEAKQVTPEDPAHKELRALKEKVLQAFNKNEIDALLEHVHPNAVLTWQNAEVSRGHEGVRNYYKKMLEGPERRVQRVTAQAEVDELTILYGDSNGLAFGTLDQDFTLTDGSAFHLKNRWTAHLVKDKARWLVSGLHVSADIFDNGVLHLIVRRTALWTGIIAGVVGLLLGVVLYWAIGAFRRRQAAGGGTR
jgi:ketosteroid isomerase-like protein